MNAITMRLEYIVQLANSVQFNDMNVHIARKFLYICDKLDKMTLEEVIEYLNVSKVAFRKFYQQLDFISFNDLKDAMRFDIEMRKTLFEERYSKFNPSKTIDIANYLIESPIDVSIVDNIVDLIHQSKSVIFYGSPSLLNLLLDFQVDMAILGKTIMTSSCSEGKMIIPESEDLLCFVSGTGRMFSLCNRIFKERILESNNRKILITQSAKVSYAFTNTLHINTINDYYEMHYVYMLYLDLIKTSYYEKYVLENRI